MRLAVSRPDHDRSLEKQHWPLGDQRDLCQPRAAQLLRSLLQPWPLPGRYSFATKMEDFIRDALKLRKAWNLGLPCTLCLLHPPSRKISLPPPPAWTQLAERQPAGGTQSALGKDPTLSGRPALAGTLAKPSEPLGLEAVVPGPEGSC